MERYAMGSAPQRTVKITAGSASTTVCPVVGFEVEEALSEDTEEAADDVSDVCEPEAVLSVLLVLLVDNTVSDTKYVLKCGTEKVAWPFFTSVESTSVAVPSSA